MSVIVYSTANCAQCEQTKRLFKRAGVPFSEFRVDESDAIAEHVKELGYTQAPVVVTDFGSWSGFRPDRIKETIERFNFSK